MRHLQNVEKMKKINPKLRRESDKNIVNLMVSKAASTESLVENKTQNPITNKRSSTVLDYKETDKSIKNANLAIHNQNLDQKSEINDHSDVSSNLAVVSCADMASRTHEHQLSTVSKIVDQTKSEIDVRDHSQLLDNSVFKNQLGDSDDSVVDTEGMVEFHDKITKNDEQYKKVKNTNLLSRKEIQDLTKFFLKQSTINLYETLDGIGKHAHKIEYPGFLDDLKTLDTLKKYVRGKHRGKEEIKQTRRKTILKSVIVILQKLASFRRMSVNDSYSNIRML